MDNVLEWLDRQSEDAPDAVAFADDREEVTYAQLDARSRAVGSFVAQHLGGRMPVAVLARKSVWAVAAMMGAVQAGCFYCVLDERQPLARLQSIASALQPGLVLVDDEHWDQASELLASMDSSAKPVSIREAAATPVSAEGLDRRRREATDLDPLYVNFTSGSTGTPKGVVVGHRSVIDFVGQFTRIFGIGAGDRLANQAPLDFDVSVKDVYGGLAAGAAVYLVPRDYFSVPTQLMDFLGDRRVTVCTWAVSAMCFVSIMGGFDYREVPSIRLVVFSGEVMPPKQLAVWRAHLPEATFVNVYGPTEVTCNCTYHVLDRDYEKDEVIPMGRPFPNEKVFLLDEEGAAVDGPDVPGEVCVAGSCLALGYLGDPEKTAAAFVQNPLEERFRETVYLTGDLARYDAAGDLVYIGRKDHQVKHMGQRIELGEIEAVVQRQPGIDRACCSYDARKKRILLYYSGESDKDALAARLREELPSYMVPNRVHRLDALPLSKNGKIDRAKLAEMV